MAASSAREAAYQTLWGRIVTMELKPGDPLNDRELAEEMGISRTPVREALIMLNIAHMVTIKPQSGTYVAPIDLKLMRLEQFARFTLEKEMLFHVHKHCKAEHIAAYRANIEEYVAASAAPDSPLKTSHMLEIDNKFHRLAFEFCGMEEHFDHMLSTFKHIAKSWIPWSRETPRPWNRPCGNTCSATRCRCRRPANATPTTSSRDKGFRTPVFTVES